MLNYKKAQKQKKDFFEERNCFKKIKCSLGLVAWNTIYNKVN